MQVIAILLVLLFCATIAASKGGRAASYRKGPRKVPKKEKPRERKKDEKADPSMPTDGLAKQMGLVSEIIAPISEEFFNLYVPPIDPKYLEKKT